MIFEGKTLEEAYEKAIAYFNKSISELEVETIQLPSKGFLGLFSKKAIINVEDNIQKETQKIEEIKENDEIKEYDINEVVEIAKKEINELFDLSCFNIDKVDVKVYDEETIIFIINGEDAALLIGKEGYRYNALLTMLFNWIFQKYGYKVKLEIAEFLLKQEEMMRKLLEPCIREIEEKGRCKTHSFDGVLIYLAVEILRKEFPDKYVAIKENRDGSKYVIINRFLNG